MGRPTVSMITVSSNSKDLVRGCLGSVIDNGRGGWKVAVTGDARVIHFAGRSLKISKPGVWD